MPGSPRMLTRHTLCGAIAACSKFPVTRAAGYWKRGRTSVFKAYSMKRSRQPNYTLPRSKFKKFYKSLFIHQRLKKNPVLIDDILWCQNIDWTKEYRDGMSIISEFKKKSQNTNRLCVQHVLQRPRFECYHLPMVCSSFRGELQCTTREVFLPIDY